MLSELTVDFGEYMKRILMAAVLCVGAASANAYNHFPLTPSWFVSVYQNLTETRDQVWRGTITEVLNPTQVAVKTTKGEIVTVNLMHLTLRKNASKRQSLISTYAVQNLVNSQVYVLGKPNRKSVTAKLIDVGGKDINLSLVATGAFDVNGTTLRFKGERQQYINALNYAKKSQLGIWQ